MRKLRIRVEKLFGQNLVFTNGILHGGKGNRDRSFEIPKECFSQKPSSGSDPLPELCVSHTAFPDAGGLGKQADGALLP